MTKTAKFKKIYEIQFHERKYPKKHDSTFVKAGSQAEAEMLFLGVFPVQKFVIEKITERF